MTVDCRWVSNKLEGYFCETLSAEETGLAHAHIENCFHCRSEIESFKAIDPIVKYYFQHQLAVAALPRRKPRVLSYGAASAVALAAVILIAVVLRTPEPVISPTPSRPEIAAVPTPGTVAPSDKTKETAEIERAKPTPPSPLATGSRDEVARREGTARNAPDFLVSDPAGYSHTLADFKGSVLILGIWNSNQTAEIANFERIYRSFSPNTKVRILGVSDEHGVKPPRTTFPVAYNQGSRLLDATAGDVLVIDAAGTVRHRGSLSSDSNNLVTTLRGVFESLGIR